MIEDKEVIARINAYVRKLHRLKSTYFMDIEDIRQELLCELIAGAKSYDQSKGNFLSFANTILQRKYFTLIEKYNRTKRTAKFPIVEYNDAYQNPRVFDETAAAIDIGRLVSKLPCRYREIINLYLNHSVSEILGITGRHRSSVYADIKRAKHILRSICLSGEESSAHVFYNVGGYMKNLSVLETLAAKEISQLEVHDLMDLSDQVAKLTSHAKELKEKLEDGLNLKFSEAVKNSLRRENKDTGTTRFFDGAFQVTAEVPKKVSWDQEKMEELVKRVPDERRKSMVKIIYVIEERKYAELPREYQELFREARTITPGKTKFQISIGEKQ
jgi:DNA-directed RNA polymerase specialized sigma24 family protein